ncbi:MULTISPECIES: transcriptional regulator [Pseudomonas]|uniref:transcriptional regulator n=1 Tax=Pseudomonas TaxID=286 RepID=UPI000343129C|nr:MULTISPECIES: transcriptional regulator [Pseudomonas]EPA96660.1 transcriptional regulator [Pseudomonas sp. G5(2012)]
MITNAVTTVLAVEEIMRACTPALAAQIKHPEDLANVRCIPDVSDWEVWARSVMPTQKFVARGPGFSLYSIAVQQALMAAGVLIGRRSLIQRYLDSGELVAPLDQSVALGMVIASWKLPGGKGNRMVAAVEDALMQLA